MANSRTVSSPNGLTLEANNNVNDSQGQFLDRNEWLKLIAELSDDCNTLERRLKSFGVLLRSQGIQKFNFKSEYYFIFNELGYIANKVSDPSFFEATKTDRENITSTLTMNSLLKSNVELLKVSVGAAWVFYSSMADFVPLDEEEHYLDLYDKIEMVDNGINIMSDIVDVNNTMSAIVYYGGYPDDLQISIDLVTSKHQRVTRIFHTFFQFDDRQ